MIPVESQYNKDRYNKEHSREMARKRGATPLIMRLYEDRDDTPPRYITQKYKPKAVVAAPPKEPKPKRPSRPYKPKTNPYSDSLKAKFKALISEILHENEAIGLTTIAKRTNALGLKLPKAT